tara:strand:- start:1227 stop:1925 length:699 start_codon:yes stop_codon:yes gene_type:complete
MRKKNKTIRNRGKTIYNNIKGKNNSKSITRKTRKIKNYNYDKYNRLNKDIDRSLKEINNQMELSHMIDMSKIKKSFNRAKSNFKNKEYGKATIHLIMGLSLLSTYSKTNDSVKINKERFTKPSVGGPMANPDTLMRYHMVGSIGDNKSNRKMLRASIKKWKKIQNSLKKEEKKNTFRKKTQKSRRDKLKSLKMKRELETIKEITNNASKVISSISRSRGRRKTRKKTSGISK